MICPDFKADFMVVGTQKGGTTALASFLHGHSEICLASEKEPHFFDLDFFFEGGQPRYAWYLMYYAHHGGQKISGEATPTYMYRSEVAGRLRDYNPRLKLIALLRHPAERAYSQYNMMRAKAFETLSFGEALRAEEARLLEAGGNRAPGSPYWIHSYKQRGRYATQIRNLLQYFPRDQLLVLRSEDLLRRHYQVLSEVFRFLGVGTDHRPPPARVFAGEYRESMSRAERELLLEYYAQETEELERLLGWDLADWKR
jgi:hypothetical protein